MLGAAVRWLFSYASHYNFWFRTFSHAFHPECHSHSNIGLALHIPWRSEIIDLDWFTENFCLVVSVVLCIYYIATDLRLSFTEMISVSPTVPVTYVLFDVNDKRYFFKQFLAGVFTMIAMTGLDQDMMQRNLSCKNFKDSQRIWLPAASPNFSSSYLFLMLGVLLLYIFTSRQGITNPAKVTSFFPMIATGGYFPAIVGACSSLGWFQQLIPQQDQPWQHWLPRSP